MSNPGSEFRTMVPAWQAVALVCKDCTKRGKAPKGLKTGEVGDALRRGLADSGLKARVVRVGCLGLCPKRAVTVAVAGASTGAVPQVAAIDSLAQATSFAQSLRR